MTLAATVSAYLSRLTTHHHPHPYSVNCLYALTHSQASAPTALSAQHLPLPHVDQPYKTSWSGYGLLPQIAMGFCTNLGDRPCYSLSLLWWLFYHPFLLIDCIFLNIAFTWASLVAQLVKNQPAMRLTWVRSLGREDPLEEGIATLSSILSWRIPMDRGAWRATVHRVTKSQTRLSDLNTPQ